MCLPIPYTYPNHAAICCVLALHFEIDCIDCMYALYFITAQR